MPTSTEIHTFRH